MPLKYHCHYLLNYFWNDLRCIRAGKNLGVLEKRNVFRFFYRATALCYSALLCYYTSVCPSVSSAVTRVGDSQERLKLELRSIQRSPHGSPMTPVSSWLNSPQNSNGNTGSGPSGGGGGRSNMEAGLLNDGIYWPFGWLALATPPLVSPKFSHVTLGVGGCPCLLYTSPSPRD